MEWNGIQYSRTEYNITPSYKSSDFEVGSINVLVLIFNETNSRENIFMCILIPQYDFYVYIE